MKIYYSIIPVKASFKMFRTLCYLIAVASLITLVSVGNTHAGGRIFITAGGQEFSSNNPGSIQQVNADGTGLTTILNLPGGSRPMGIVLDLPNGHFYWNDWNFRLTQRANLDGTSVASIQAHGSSGLNHLALDVSDNRIYSTGGAGLRRVERFNLDGTGNLQTPVPPGQLFFPHGIALDLPNGHMYVGDPGINPTGIHRYNLDGTGNTVLISPALFPGNFGSCGGGSPMQGRGRGMALDLANGKMYFGGHPRLPDLFGCPPALGEIWVANLDGTGLQLLIAGLEKVTDVRLDLGAGKIYWADARLGKVQRANLDGSNIEDVVTGVPTPFGIALDLQTITVSPEAATNPVGTDHTVTGLIVDQDGNPVIGTVVTFTVVSGPNAGQTDTATTDTNGEASFTYTGSGGVGTDEVVATFTDSSGNTMSSNPVQKEWTNRPPVALCQNPTVSAGSSCTAPANVDDGSFDPDGDAITLDQVPPGPFGLGNTGVILTVTDIPGGLTDSCSATVTVLDTTAPVVSCPADQVLECTGPNGANATVIATATDNCSVGPATCTPPSGLFPIGMTAVSCSATDGSDNSASCSTKVTVVDTTKPTISCVESVNPSGKKVPTASNTNQDGFYVVGASDVCDSTPNITFGGIPLANGETIKITQTPGKSGVRFVNTMGPLKIKHFQVGPLDAVIAATDGSGNVETVTCLVPPPPK